MGLAPFLALAFQRDTFGTGIIDPDAELFPGIGTILIFPEAPILIIIEIQTADAVHAVFPGMAVRRNQMSDPVFQHRYLRISDLVFQLMAIFHIITFLFFVYESHTLEQN